MSWPTEYSHVFSLLEKVRSGAVPNQFYAACPGHEDQHPSLSLYVNGEKLAVKCHGPGCSFQRIVAALSSKAGHYVWLRPYNKPPNGKDWRQPRWEYKLMVESTYPYTDEHGEILYEVCRGRESDGKKRFWQRVPDPSLPGGYRLSLDGVRRVLYHLPDLHANAQQLPEKRRMVVICEGEKDCDNLAALGILATTNSGGAGKFHLSEYQVLFGQHIVILPDHDPIYPNGRRPGWDHAVSVADILHGKASAVRIARLPVAEGEDVTDWLEGLPASMDAQARKRALWDLIRHAPLYDPWNVGMPVPAFVREQLRTLMVARQECLSGYKSAAEVIGDLESQLHALIAHLGECRAQDKTPDPATLLARLATLGAACERGAEDLRLVSRLDTTTHPG